MLLFARVPYILHVTITCTGYCAGVAQAYLLLLQLSDGVLRIRAQVIREDQQAQHLKLSNLLLQLLLVQSAQVLSVCPPHKPSC